MDPNLRELLNEGDPDDEVRAAIRLRHAGRAPSGVRLVAQFGDIATCRVRRRAISAVRADPRVASLKAPDAVIPESMPRAISPPAPLDVATVRTDARRPGNLPVAGRGVVVGVVDWGADPVHPNFRHADGRTRILALWDQRKRPRRVARNRYGYGEMYSASAINQALADANPYAALRYDPRDADPDGSGTHGTHVLDIAAGNGRRGPAGIAPEADLVFVHLASTGTMGLATLGDSVTLLEAVDFIARAAGERPWVINLSMGNHGGPHDGSTLVEQGIDRVLQSAPGRVIVQSCGNYFERDTHTFGWIGPDEVKVLTWETDRADVTANELEVWYSGRDRFAVAVAGPSGARSRLVALGERAEIVHGDRVVGRVYHRAFDPNNGDHHVNVFLYPDGPAGHWHVRLQGEDIRDGRYHGWIERDEACRRCQSRFTPADAAPFSTTGTICNGHWNIAVGACDAHTSEPAPFSSVGPTRDGRQKPDLCAPGVAVLAARSGPWNFEAGVDLVTRKSGTSMAAPHVTGCVALMFEAAPRPLRIEETRRLLLSTVSPAEMSVEIPERFGHGHLDVIAAVNAASAIDVSETTRRRSREEGSVESRVMVDIAEAEDAEDFEAEDLSDREQGLEFTEGGASDRAPRHPAEHLCSADFCQT